VSDDSMFRQVLSNIGEGSLERYMNLSPAARRFFLSQAEEVLVKRDKAALEALYAFDYERIPPTPEVFLDSMDYLGHYKEELYPNWRPHFIRVCDPHSGVHELVLTGAQGLGKTTFAMMVLAFKLCRLFCLRQPNVFYGFNPRAMLFFGLYAVTKTLIKQVGFYELRDVLLDQSPFFRDLYPRLPMGREYIHWPQKCIQVITGSTKMHALGRNLFACSADELNYYHMGEKTENKAHDMVAEVSRRMESRFIEEGGDIPGIGIYVSQTRTSSDFLEQRIKDKKGSRGVYIVRGPRWSINTKGYHRERNRGFQPGDPTFRVYTGSETTDARVLDHVERRMDGGYYIEPVAPETEGGLDPSLILHVPVLHFRAHKDDLYESLRVIDDVPTGGFNPFFPRREVLRDVFDPELVFPFTAQELPVYEGQSAQLQDAFEHDLVTRIEMGRLRPIRHPHAPRYVHLDLSQGGDRTGIAMVHPSGHEVVERSAEDLANDSARVGEGEVVKTVEVDFYLGIIGGPFRQPIDYRRIRVFIDWLRRIGYHIASVTADQYMSFDFLQRMRDAGFHAENQSTDKTSQPYKDTRQAMNEHRVVAPWPRGLMVGSAAELVRVARPEAVEAALARVILYQELAGLEHDVKRDKIDHRDRNPDGSKGSKDVADAVAGAVFRCLTDKTAPMDPQPGARPRDQLRQRFDPYLERARR